MHNTSSSQMLRSIPNAILNTFINAATTNRYGVEFTLQQQVGKNFDITPSVNLQYRRVKAAVNNLNLNNEVLTGKRN
jgi:outer membrane receptor protein involved in Fe transport